MTAMAGAPNVGDRQHPFDRVLEALRRANRRVVVRSRTFARACCPTHPDRKPSLCITRLEDRVLLDCKAGCLTSKVVHALGLQMRDLFLYPPGLGPSRTEVARYDYSDLSGQLIAQKVRYYPKKFSWRRP